MTQVTIDEIEYDSSDFTEKETALLQGIQYNTTVKQQLSYQLQCVNAIGEDIVSKLKAHLTSNDEEDDEDN
tara:strand:+ start:285 stop:497 length:213 start_codon:yes stop_codon:yes gene_type:complete